MNVVFEQFKIRRMGLLSCGVVWSIGLLTSAVLGQVSTPPAPVIAAMPVTYCPSNFTGESITAAIRRAQADGGRVYLPGGIYQISRTIDLSMLKPMSIEGEAPFVGEQWRGRGSVELRWTGPEGGTLLRLHGQNTLISNIGFNGAGKAGIGVNLVNVRGWGSSMDHFANCAWSNFAGPCIQAGERPADWNAADATWDRCIMMNSRVGFRVVHDQGVNYDFANCTFSTLDTVIDAQHGGSITIHGGESAAFKTLVHIGVGGPNTGPVIFRDTRAENWGAFIDAQDCVGGGQLILDGFRTAGGRGADIPNRIGGRVIVSLRDAQFEAGSKWELQGNPAWPEGPAHLIFDSTRGIDPPSISQGQNALVEVRHQ